MNKTQVYNQFLEAYHSKAPMLELEKFFQLDLFNNYQENQHYQWLIYQVKRLQNDDPDNLPGMLYGMIYTAFCDHLLVDMFHTPLDISDFQWSESE